MTNSLQSRLLVGSGLVIATGMLIAFTAVRAWTSTTLFAEFDRSLYARAQSLAILVEETDEGIEIEFEESKFAEFARAYAPDYFQIWHADGTTLAKSRALGDRDLPYDGRNQTTPVFADVVWSGEPTRRQVIMQWRPQIDTDDEDELGDERTADGEESVDGRAETKNDGTDVVELRADYWLTMTLARSTGDLTAMLGKVAWLLAIVGSLATLGCLAGLLLVIRRGLRPVQQIATELAEIDEHRLDQQIDATATASELAPIAIRLNDLLKRLEVAFLREQDFSNNVAHELRTPLAGLRSTIEVYLSQPHQAAEYRSALHACLEICNQSAGMVESLLELSRVERQHCGIERRPVRLDRLLQECWAPLEEQSKTKGLKATWDVSPMKLITDRDKIRLVIRNVLSNAVNHCDEHGTMKVATLARNGKIQISVVNSGNRLESTQMDRVFDRFWRGDDSRNGTGEHFGLGLTLAKSLTSVLGGQINVHARGQDLFCVDISFPPSI